MAPALIVDLSPIHCDKCAITVEDVLIGLLQVHEAMVDRTTEQLTLRCDPDVAFDDVASWLSDIGIRTFREVKN